MNKVLLIDDDQVLVEMYKLKFEHAGFEADTASDGQQGFAKIRTFKPDLILLDLLLPGISGKALFDKIRFDNELKDTAVIILTNLDNPTVRADFLRRGVKDFFVKSELTPAQVVDKSKQILENRS